MAIEFNVKVVDATTGQLVTTPLVVRVDAGLSGTVRNTNPANFYVGPPKTPPWVGDVEVIAAGYAPWSTGANPQARLSNATVEVVASLQPFKKPFKTAPRFWKANMCGVRVPGLPPVDGGAPDPSLVLSWMYDRYSAEDRARIRRAWKGE